MDRYYTDYPFTSLGDTKGKIAPIREIKILEYDGDKYCVVRVLGTTAVESIKYGYIYKNKVRNNQNPVLLSQKELIKYF